MNQYSRLPRHPVGLPTDPFPRHHLDVLLSTCNELIQDRRALIDIMRAELLRLRAERARLQGQQAMLRRNGGEASEDGIARLEREFGLTTREAEVAVLLAAGRGNAAIAAALGISPHTARHHTQRVLGKLGVHSRAEAGALLRR